MNKGFTPFAASLKARALKSSVASGQAQAGDFRPITANGGNSPHGPHAGEEPKISVERTGDRITLIRVQCPCGNVIEVECLP